MRDFTEVLLWLLELIVVFSSFYSCVTFQRLSADSLGAQDGVGVLLAEDRNVVVSVIEDRFDHVFRLLVLRFGMWDEIKAIVLPQDQELFSFTTAVIHYTKSIAYAATNNVPEAAMLFLCAHV